MSLRLKGNLNEFPFPDGQIGRVPGHGQGDGRHARLRERLAADREHRRRPPVPRQPHGSAARGRATITRRARSAHVQAEIPDLKQPDEVLTVTGEAEGPTREFLRLHREEPGDGMIDHFTDSWQAQGAGKLTLKLELPLRATEKGQVAGAYQFAGNTVVADPDLPRDRAGERARRVHRGERARAGHHRARSSAARSRSPPARRRTAPFASPRRDASTRTTCASAGTCRRGCRACAGATDWRAVQTRAEARVRHRDRIGPAGTRAGPARAAREGGRRRACRCASSGARSGRTRSASRSGSATS